MEKRTQKLIDLKQDPNFVIYSELESLNESIESLIKLLSKKEGVVGGGNNNEEPRLLRIEGLDKMIIQGPPGPPGGKFIPSEEDLQMIASRVVVPEGKPVIIEKTEVIHEQPIVTEVTKVEVKEVAVTESAEETVRKINSLPIRPMTQIDASHIKNLPTVDTRLFQQRGSVRMGRGTSSPVMVYDLTAQVGGTKVFSIPSNSRVISVMSTSFPMIYRPIVDYGTSGSNNSVLTLTDQVAEPEAGQTLLVLYVES